MSAAVESLSWSACSCSSTWSLQAVTAGPRSATCEAADERSQVASCTVYNLSWVSPWAFHLLRSWCSGSDHEAPGHGWISSVGSSTLSVSAFSSVMSHLGIRPSSHGLAACPLLALESQRAQDPQGLPGFYPLWGQPSWHSHPLRRTDQAQLLQWGPFFKYSMCSATETWPSPVHKWSSRRKRNSKKVLFNLEWLFYSVLSKDDDSNDPKATHRVHGSVHFF